MDKVEKRDAFGDWIPPGMEGGWTGFWAARKTYVFHYLDEKSGDYLPYFGVEGTSPSAIEKARKMPDFLELQLYRTPPPSVSAEVIGYLNWQLDLLVRYFKEVFNERCFVEETMPGHRFTRLILPKSLYAKIKRVIDEFAFGPIHDLMLEIIATARHEYVQHIAQWDTPKMQDLVKKAPKAVTNAIEILDRIERPRRKKGKPASELVGIGVHFSDGTVEIGHPWMALSWMEAVKRDLEKYGYKDWRKELERFPSTFDDNLKPLRFKERLARSFYNLLTEGKFITVTKKTPYPSKVIRCIADLITLILPVGGIGEVDDKVKQNNARNWLTRGHLEPMPTGIDIPADLDRLEKYFESDFIKMEGTSKSMEAVQAGYFVGIRFGIQEAIPALTHIAQCLVNVRWMMDHQLIGPGRPFERSFPNYVAWSGLVNGIMGGRKIKKMTYVLEGEDEERTLDERLPLYLTEQALKQFAEEDRLEIDVEPVRTVMKPTGGAVPG